ncbi:alpha/beta hydrolase [Nocardioides sp. LHG3406-4]|uniref:alpha/beta hydrolase n=1 Tax=Nocardioides sp. LHG3406-4 TaxID=2804575 RepID=UPI003CF222FB
MAEPLTTDRGTQPHEPGRARRIASRIGGTARGCLECSLPGAWVALVLVALSLTPSLLPRPPTYQGAVSGLSAVVGYGIGVFGAWLWREFADRGPRAPSRRSWRIFWVAGGLTLVVAAAVSLRWQGQLRDLVDVAPPGAASYLLIPVVAGLIFVAALAIGRVIRRTYRWLGGQLERRVGARAARASAFVLLTCTAALVLSGLVLDGLVSMADRSFALLDTKTTGGAVQPTSTLRSGGPGSLVSWESLGRQGRRFTGTGPTADDITGFTGTPAKEPIRAYAGYASAENTEERAALAVDELERAGGFDRSYVLVVTTTGTGIVEPSSASSFEYLTGGDSAIVATQYSHLPSWLSYLVDREEAREAGRDLFDEVYGRWSQLPADDRPELMVYGESLGSFGGENAFSGERDLANRTSGALYVGPPSFNPLYGDFVEDRDPGSPQVEPTYNQGRTIRFSGRPREGIPPEASPWTGTRVLYMQHASDPITWWSPSLVLQEPDWLEEPPGRDVLDDMTWIPFVTFWQVSADLALSFSTPPGHGHVYTGEHVDGWAAVLQPADWSDEKATRLRQIILAE